LQGGQIKIKNWVGNRIDAESKDFHKMIPDAGCQIPDAGYIARYKVVHIDCSGSIARGMHESIQS